jgi:hypothetical protein
MAESATMAAADCSLSRLRERAGVRARATGCTLTLPSLTQRAPPSPAGAGEGLFGLDFHGSLSKDEGGSISSNREYQPRESLATAGAFFAESAVSCRPS